MKFIPDAIARKVASQQLLASEHAPRILFVGGVVGMVGSTVLACRATLKLEDVLDHIESEKRKAHRIKDHVESDAYDGDATYSDRELQRDIAQITLRGAGNIARLYAPAILLGGVSIAALTKSHNILQDRNLAITAAYIAVDEAFARYRERVVDRYGEDVDRDFRYESETVDILDEETGEIVATTMVTDHPGEPYARWFDQESSRNWSRDPEINLYFLKNVQTYCTDRLRARGHLFLNEVLDELGLEHTRAGAIVGWRWLEPDHPEVGDNYIDFGIWEGTHQEVNDFFNGREGAILLSFNVDGPIINSLEEGL